MANDKVQLTVKKLKGNKPSLEDMYLIDEPVKTQSKLDEVKEFLRDAGEDPRDYTNAQLRNMIRNGFQYEDDSWRTG